MVDLQYCIEFYSYWHCGSGMAAGADVDALVVKDGDGLPYVPGKTVMGLIRQAYEELYGENIALFGKETGNIAAESFFSDAVIGRERSMILAKNWQHSLFRTVSSTAIDPQGIALGHSLRKMQVTVPCKMEGCILHIPEEEADRLSHAMALVKQMGYHRSRGLGRCCMSIIGTVSPGPAPAVQESGSLFFKVTLLSDVILNSRAASAEPNKTLDFIPGNVFLGIASKEYGDFGEDRMTVFHSGKIRFSDAHPLVGGARALRVPASLYYPKLSSPTRETYHHHVLGEVTEEMRLKQLKQCRGGFYDFTSSPARKASVHMSFAVKSAYDREKRRAKDEQMFQYESLCKGMQFVFEVRVDPDVRPETVAHVRKSLSGIRHVGRSRSAQYGLVRIELMTEPVGLPASRVHSSVGGLHYVYADGRLVFLDTCGQLTCRPTARDLGFENGTVRWDLSQIRTFRYAPWNGIRRSFDTERFGIEKGSVLVVESPEDAPTVDAIGLYKNEGFGRVLYNPAFLDDPGLRLADEAPEVPWNSIESQDVDSSTLLRFLSTEALEGKYRAHIYRKVNDWMRRFSREFENDSYASQWGTVRSIAAKKHSYEDLMPSLFGRDQDQASLDRAFLRHGVAKSKWDGDGYGGKKYLFLKEDFIETLVREGLPKDWVWKAVVNLATEMGKK